MSAFTPLDPDAAARWERWRRLERQLRAADVTIVVARARAALAATVEAQVPDGPRALEARAYLTGRRALALRELDRALRRRSLVRARRARLHASLGPQVPADARVGAAEARLVRDGDYPGEVLRMVAGARERVWCSIFLVELDPVRDPDLAVSSLLAELASARWRGVDARLLVGGSRTNLAIGETAVAAVAWARGLRLPARTIGRPGTRGSHAKVVVADDLVLTGSHNWSPGSFGGGQSQDSVLVRSADLAAYACGLFLEAWRRAEEPTP